MVYINLSPASTRQRQTPLTAFLPFPTQTSVRGRQAALTLRDELKAWICLALPEVSWGEHSLRACQRNYCFIGMNMYWIYIYISTYSVQLFGWQATLPVPGRCKQGRSPPRQLLLVSAQLNFAPFLTKVHSPVLPPYIRGWKSWKRLWYHHHASQKKLFRQYVLWDRHSAKQLGMWLSVVLTQCPNQY